MTTQPPIDDPRAAVGVCSYCGIRVYASEHWYAVTTILGCIRLCDACGANDPHALAGNEASWRAAGNLPENYRRRKPNRKGKKGVL